MRGKLNVPSSFVVSVFIGVALAGCCRTGRPQHRRPRPETASKTPPRAAQCPRCAPAPKPLDVWRALKKPRFTPTDLFFLKLPERSCAPTGRRPGRKATFAFVEENVQAPVPAPSDWDLKPPSGPASDLSRLLQARKEMVAGRLGRARAVLPRVHGRGTRDGRFRSYLTAWLDLYAGRNARAARQLATLLKQATFPGRAAVYRDLVNVLARRQLTGSPDQWVAPLAPGTNTKLKVKALMALAEALAKRGEHSRAIATYAAARKTGTLTVGQDEKALMGSVSSHIRMNRDDLAILEIWSRLRLAARSKARRPGPKLCKEMEETVALLAALRHALAERTRVHWHAQIALYGYQVYFMMPWRTVWRMKDFVIANRVVGLAWDLGRLSSKKRMCSKPPPSTRRPKGRMRVHTTTYVIIPHRSSTGVRRTIRRGMNQVRACYEDALLRKRDSRGLLTIRFVIDHIGKVIVAKRGYDSTRDAVLARCVVDKAKGWRFRVFPPTSGITLVSYPFRFKSGSTP